MTEFSESYQPPNEIKSGAVAASNKRRKIITDALMLALNREIEKDGVMTKRINILADKLVEKACEGDVAAIRETADRVEGKPVQAIEASGPDGGPMVSKVLLVAPGVDGSED